MRPVSIYIRFYMHRPFVLLLLVIYAGTREKLLVVRNGVNGDLIRDNNVHCSAQINQLFVIRNQWGSVFSKTGLSFVICITSKIVYVH